MRFNNPEMLKKNRRRTAERESKVRMAKAWAKIGKQQEEAAAEVRSAEEIFSSWKAKNFGWWKKYGTNVA